jgi:hypothetical protein
MGLPGIIDAVVDRSGPQVVLHILDRGAGFRHFSRLPSDILSESGRGLFIIAAMTCEFTVRSESTEEVTPAPCLWVGIRNHSSETKRSRLYRIRSQ